MKLRQFVALAAMAAASPLYAADAASTAVLKQALEAQGGEQKLRAVKTVAFESSGYRNMLEQSERPEGPWLVAFLDITELHDHEHKALRRDVKMAVPPAQQWNTSLVVSGDVAMNAFGANQVPGNSADVKRAGESMALSPERVLLSALDAADTHLEASQVLHGVPHQVLAFILDGAPVRIYLNQATHLPFAVDYAGPLAHAAYGAFVGDATQRVTWTFWRLDKSGLRYPMQWDVQLNGLPDRTLMLRALKVDAPFDPALTAIPEAVAARYKPDAPVPGPDTTPLGAKRTEIAPGIVQIEASWDVAIVDQGDGLVVIEAPISSNYSKQVLDEAARRYPGKRVKAVVSTSDSWPHLAGIREYAARGIPIYALGLSEPIVRRTLAAPHTRQPDSLQRVPRKPELHWVRGKTVIGSGPNRVELYPIMGATSERQMMAYFPQHHLLYGSDPFQKRQDGSYTAAQPVSELVQAVARERLAVDRFFMMHLPPAPYSELLSVSGEAD